MGAGYGFLGRVCNQGGCFVRTGRAAPQDLCRVWRGRGARVSCRLGIRSPRLAQQQLQGPRGTQPLPVSCHLSPRPICQLSTMGAVRDSTCVQIKGRGPESGPGSCRHCPLQPLRGQEKIQGRIRTDCGEPNLMVDTWGLEGWGQGRHLPVAIMGPSPARESSADLELNSSPPFPPPLYSSEPQPQLTPSVPHFPQSRKASVTLYQ